MSVTYRNASDVIPTVQMEVDDPEPKQAEGPEEIFVAPPPKLTRKETVKLPPAVVADGKVTNPEPLTVHEYRGRGADKKPRKKKKMTPAALEGLAKARAKAKANREARKAAKAAKAEAGKAKAEPEIEKPKPDTVKRVTMKHEYDSQDYREFLEYREFMNKRKRHQTTRVAARAPVERVVQQPPRTQKQPQRQRLQQVNRHQGSNQPSGQRQVQRQRQRQPQRQPQPSVFQQLQSQNPWEGLFS